MTAHIRCLRGASLRPSQLASRHIKTRESSLSQHLLAQKSRQKWQHQCNNQSHRFFATSVSANDSSSKTDGHVNDNSKESFLVTKYRAMANEAKVALDEHQIKALSELDRLRNDILSSSVYSSSKTDYSSIGDGEEKGSVFPFMNKISSLFQNSGGGGMFNAAVVKSAPKGVYLHGGVGCGKTFCMNLFFDSLPIESKQQVHFYKFMLNVHKTMHQVKMIDGIKGDVLPTVIDRTIQNGLVICFDEFQVTDVADALLLRRLFTGLLDRGAIVVATSNRPPGDLYLNGLQRSLFLPFIDLLETKSEVVSMWDSEIDYRLVQGANKARGVYFVGSDAKADFDASFQELTKGSMTVSTTLETQGRSIEVPKASLEYRVARFSFDDLCRKARGAGK